MSDKVRKIRLINRAESGLAVFTEVWLDDRQINASLDRVVIDVNEGVVNVTLRFPAVDVEYDGYALVEAK